MTTLHHVSNNYCFDGQQRVYRHFSTSIQSEMQFAIYLPSNAAHQKLPCIFWLSGLTCSEQNFITKAGSQRLAALFNVIIVTPDTSPRGLHLPNETTQFNLGEGAGFYLDATELPWAHHYNMQTYVINELYPLLLENFSIDSTQISIMGHSMGGLGALTLALKHPNLFRKVSAFAPICAPMQSSLTEPAYRHYLGDDKTAWAAYDPATLLRQHGWNQEILIDQGTEDNFLPHDLHPDVFATACQDMGVALQLRYHAGYDHGYYFIATFLEEHFRFHLGPQ